MAHATAHRASTPLAPLTDFVSVTKAVADARRARILKLLAADSFGVLELGSILEMAQPAVSHHLKTLRLAGLVSQRREGNAIFYRRSIPDAGSLEAALFQSLDAEALEPRLAKRVQQIYRTRQARSDAFFASNADALKHQRKLITGPEVYLDELRTAWRDLPRRQRALEVGPGDGCLLRELAADFDTVVGVDTSGAMLEATTRTVADIANVRLRECDYTALPRRRYYDFIVTAMVLHHLPSPSAFFKHAAAMLRTDGCLSVVELCEHEHQWVHEACGDVWLGFAAADLVRYAGNAGLVAAAPIYLAQRNGFRIQILHFRTR